MNPLVKNAEVTNAVRYGISDGIKLLATTGIVLTHPKIPYSTSPKGVSSNFFQSQTSHIMKIQWLDTPFGEVLYGILGCVSTIPVVANSLIPSDIPYRTALVTSAFFTNGFIKAAIDCDINTTHNNSRCHNFSRNRASRIRTVNSVFSVIAFAGGLFFTMEEDETIWNRLMRKCNFNIWEKEFWMYLFLAVIARLCGMTLAQKIHTIESDD
eukprot:TRINITY_DN3375_c2_g1_i1.p1 TRINITY_DN3375_c2_g1~~TRINITY_DN3375_c2_g1_i1.p1  ORF type:complete len:211 (+),score=19.91 TRINITY_DN3375_c2_g1_i1:371-1003(+)